MFPHATLCDSRFRPLLAAFDLDRLAADEGTTYGLWPDLTMAYANPAWTRFAAETGGGPVISADWNLGRCILEAVAQPLRRFFGEHYRRCLRESRPWEHSYECSSAETYRGFHMTVFPLGESEGLLVVNSLRIKNAHARAPHPPLESRYRSAEGFVNQCCHCRRVRRGENESLWDWVPEWVKEQPERTSHGICTPCFGFYYGDSRHGPHGFAEPFSTIA